MNASHIIQSADSELSETGKEQAEFLAKRVSNLPIEIIISSPMKRARQTSEIINAHLQKEVIFSDLLREWSEPEEMIGKHRDHPDMLKVWALRKENQMNPSWRYSTEESLADLRNRAQELIDFLSGRKEQNILCVSHSGFLKLIILTMALGEKLTPELWFALYDFFRIKNTGITLCELDEEGKWRLHTWNDHAHLG